MKKSICIMLISLLTITALSGCSRQQQPQPTVTPEPQTLAYTTYEEFEANSKHLHPEKDENFRYALYDNFAQIIECFSTEPNIVIPDTYKGVPVIGIRSTALRGNKTMKHLTLGANILKIENDSFANCTALTQVKMSNSIKDLGQGAFSGCTKLTSIVIPPKIKKIASGTFANCESLRKVVVESAFMAVDSSDEKISSESSKRTIEAGAFSNCKRLAIMWIPEDITTVGNSILSGNSSKPLICGGDATASSWFATLQCLDYELVSREDFDAHARFHNETLETKKTPVGSSIHCKNFSLTLDDVQYYNKLGSYTAGDNKVLVAVKFTITNNAMISQYFDGLKAKCSCQAPGKDGLIDDFIKRPLMLSTNVLGLRYPVGDVAPNSPLTGIMVFRVSDRFDSIQIDFEGADEPFII